MHTGVHSFQSQQLIQEITFKLWTGCLWQFHSPSSTLDKKKILLRQAHLVKTAEILQNGTAPQCASFKFHPDVNCSAEKRNGGSKLHMTLSAGQLDFPSC
jgi:hypothetical protein